MSDTITPQGTTRTAFSISTNDLEINGDVIAGKFIGSGERITELNINNITKGNALSKLFGGTNNSDYIDQGIVFNNNSTIQSENKLLTSSRLRWNNQTNILYINDKNFIQDSSNYVNYTSNNLLNNIQETSNIIIENILDHIETTLGIDNTTGIPIASATRSGTIKVGEGLFMTSDGFLSINPEKIQIEIPSIIPSLPLLNLYQSTLKSVYKKYIFTYDPNRGTTFEFDESLDDIGTVLPFWYKFNSIVSSDGVNTINNKGNTSALSSANTYNTNLILHGNATIMPSNDELIYEYTPLKNKYLILDGTIGTYAEFNESCDIVNIYNNISELGGNVVGITFAFWFKCSNPEHEKTFLLFGDSTFSDYLNIYIKDIDGSFKLVVNIFNFSKNEHIISNTANLFDGKWHHFIWSINSSGTWNI